MGPSTKLRGSSPPLDTNTTPPGCTARLRVTRPAAQSAWHRALRSFPMPDTAIDPIPKQGKFRRALAAVGAWLQALDYTGFDYTLDRTERLERELAQLKEELRQSREASFSDAHPCVYRKPYPS